MWKCRFLLPLILFASVGAHAATDGCGATNDGTSPYDQAYCGNETADGTVLSYEPNYNDGQAKIISSCGATIDAAGSYKLNANLSCDPATVAIYIRTLNPGVYLNLNGQTVEGEILTDDADGPFLGGVDVFGGTVNCNLGSPNACLYTIYTYGTPPPATPVVYHHITGQNSADDGLFAYINASLEAPLPSGALSAVIHHLTIVLPGGTQSPSRCDGAAIDGENETAAMYNMLVTNSAGTNHYSEPLICYNVYSCRINNNDIVMNQFTGNGDSVPGRAILLDGDAFGNGPLSPGFTESANVYNNYVECNDTRGVRQRSARRVRVHDNLFDQVTDGPQEYASYLGAVHWGEPTAPGPGGVDLYDYLGSVYYHNTFVFEPPGTYGAIAFHGRSATNLSFTHNSITCVAGGCLFDTERGAVVQAFIQPQQNQTGPNYFSVGASGNSIGGLLVMPLYGNGTSETQTSQITFGSGLCTAVDGAICVP